VEIDNASVEIMIAKVEFVTASAEFSLARMGVVSAEFLSPSYSFRTVGGLKILVASVV
jgi:hypothetical protein